MTTSAPEDKHEAEEPDFKPLTAEEAAEWRRRNPSVSVVRVVKWQLVVGVVLAVLVGLITQRAGWLWSVAYGAAAVVIPAALFARGLRLQLGAGQENLAMVRFFGLEIAKLVLTVVLLLLAPLVVPGLNWLALVLGLVVVMKTYWLALWLLTRSE
ncbi:ATP synthase subunit I [Comamonas odontotermitis]|uniref:ATP synthase subunit I n=1 Tax=Comamonas TaxID=283 RepID=UPI001CC3FA40|nr:ATP synthase subunit I [Comamonas odontotermitis]UBB17486.1 ATP synthase subunit I [Comamonas odontotermitis]